MYIVAIPKDETKKRVVIRDDEELRWKEVREKSRLDWNSGIDHARREGR
jgi:hypothetical protein